MPTSPDLSLIVPAYREGERLAGTLDAIVSYLERSPDAFEIIVAADGDDATRREAERRGRADRRIVVTGSPARRGKGRAVREGMALARGRVIGYLDGDGQVPVEELAKLLCWLEAGWDIAVGSRALPGSQIEGRRPLHRRVGSVVFAALARRFCGLRGLRDPQCGLKVFRAEVARELFARQRIDGYLFDLELLVLARASGYRTREVPIRWRAEGGSRFDALRGSPRILLDLARIVLQRAWDPSPAAGRAAGGSRAASTRSAAS
jgi:glycosyltransferase involved in cell wall biosynthesis